VNDLNEISAADQADAFVQHDSFPGLFHVTTRSPITRHTGGWELMVRPQVHRHTRHQSKQPNEDLTMPTLSNELRRRLISQFGATSFEGKSELVAELLREIALEIDTPHLDPNGYDKTYTEGYNKGDYSKANYSRYDKTNAPYEEIMRVILPELERLVVEKLREQQK
jgi:hypothetical protein